MNKQIRMQANQQKKQQKKAALEKLSNKMLVIFTAGLLSEVVLMYLYSFMRNSSMINGANVFVAILTFISIAALIVLFVKAKKSTDEAKKKTLKNWGWFAVAYAAISFLISYNKIFSWLFFWSNNAQTWLRTIMSKITFGQSQLRIVLGTMIAIAIYLVVSIIVISVKSSKIKKQ